MLGGQGGYVSDGAFWAAGGGDVAGGNDPGSGNNGNNDAAGFRLSAVAGDPGRHTSRGSCHSRPVAGGKPDVNSVLCPRNSPKFVSPKFTEGGRCGVGRTRRA